MTDTNCYQYLVFVMKSCKSFSLWNKVKNSPLQNRNLSVGHLFLWVKRPGLGKPSIPTYCTLSVQWTSIPVGGVGVSMDAKRDSA